MKRWILPGGILLLVIKIISALLTNNAFADNRQVTMGACTEFNPITFGILPLVSAERLVTRFTPLVDYLSRHLNAQVRLETAPSFTEFSRRTIQDKRYDILFTAPHFYPPARQAGYQLIASVNSPGMRAIIVVPKQSDISRIADLRGKRMATVGKKSLATLLVKKLLNAQDMSLYQALNITFTPTHNASLLSSYHGVTDASVLMEPPYNVASEQVRNRMRIIAKTDRAPHVPISVGHRLNKTCANEITQLLLNMSSTVDGQAVLKHNRFPGFRVSADAEYETFTNNL